MRVTRRDPSPARHRAVLAAALSVFALAGGCGGDEESSGPSDDPSEQGAGSQAPKGAEETQSQRPPSSEEESLEGPDVGRPTTITGPGGVPTIIRPGLPQTQVAQPSDGCVRRRRGGGLTPLVLPPRPGLRAQRVDDDSIVVRYALPARDPRCRPFRLRLTLYSSGPEGGSDTELHRIRGRRGRIRLQASSVAPPPDVARASTVMRDGLRSPVASVLIQ